MAYRPHSGGLSRRRFLRAAATASAIPSLQGARVWGANQPYDGKLLVTLQLDGGADVTQLCDPKVNVKGEPKINNWADSADPGEAGNILYAPVADNKWLFDTYGADMLVVNGVDAMTNSHETGRLFNWTGSNAEGKPSLTALHAASNSPEQPLAYSVFGGTSRTSGIIGYNRFSDLSAMKALSQPRRSSWDDQLKRPEEEFATVDNIVSNELARLETQNLSPRQRASLERFTVARTKRDSLISLAEILPAQDDIVEQDQFMVGTQSFWDNLKQQMQSALLVFKSGLGSAADLQVSGFDSHDNHDAIHEQLYINLASSINYFWDYADQLGLADRILLVIGSDFGRTNMYNDGEGKDHWPVGSYIIMERDAPWGNRVVGASDELHFAKTINPKTLKEDSKGVLITPAHVHLAIQKYLGFDRFAQNLGLGIGEVEALPLFDASKRTGA